MVELTDGNTSEHLVQQLLSKYNILIKDLKSKTGKDYLRIAVRNTEDNDVLLNALHTELDK